MMMVWPFSLRRNDSTKFTVCLKFSLAFPVMSSAMKI